MEHPLTARDRHLAWRLAILNAAELDGSNESAAEIAEALAGVGFTIGDAASVSHLPRDVTDASAIEWFMTPRTPWHADLIAALERQEGLDQHLLDMFTGAAPSGARRLRAMLDDYLDPPALAAGSALGGSYLRTRGEVRAWSRRRIMHDHDSHGLELHARLEQLEFPVVIGGRSAIVGADVTPSRDYPGVRISVNKDGLPDQAAVALTLAEEHGWTPCDAEFRRALEQGRAAAQAVLLRSGFSDREVGAITGIALRLRNLAPPAQQTGRSAGLPLAMWLIDEVAGRDLPDHRFAFSGGVAADGRLEPVPEEVVTTKLRALASDPLIDGLVLCTDASIDHPKLVALPSGSTVDDVAQTVWGQAWDRVVDDRRSEAMAALGLYIGPDPLGGKAGAVTRWGRTYEVSTEQQQRLLQLIIASPTEKWLVLLGAAGTGKTWMVEHVTSKLAGEGWETLHLTVASGSEPSVHEIETAVALHLDRTAHSRQRLVVIDGVNWMPRDDYISNLGQSLAEAFGASVVIVGLLDRDPGRIQSELMESVLPISGLAARRDFANRLVLSDYQRLTKVSGAIETCIRQSGDDVRTLVALVLDAGAADDDEPLGPAPIELLLRELDERQLRTVAGVAVVSRLGLVWDTELQLDPATAARIGLSRDTDGGLRMVGPAQIALAMKEDERRRRRRQDDLAGDHLIWYLRSLIADQPGRVAPTLARIRSFELPDDTLLRRVIREIPEELRDWRARAHAAEISRVLHFALRDVDDPAAWANSLHDRTIEEFGALPPNELARIIGTFVEVSDLLLATGRESAHDHAEGQLRGLVDRTLTSIHHVLARVDRPVERASLFDALVRLEQGHIDDSVSQSAEAFLEFSGPLRRDDLAFMIRFDTRMFRANVTWTTDGDFANLSPVRTILDGSVEDDGRYGTRLMRIALEVRSTPRGLATDWDPVHERMIEVVVDPPATCTVEELTSALGLFSALNRPFTTALLNRMARQHSFDERGFQAMLFRSSASQVAVFVDTVRGLHALAAVGLLWLRNAPREELADHLARRIKRDADGRGAGLVANAAHRVDELVLRDGAGFADIVIARLGATFLPQQLRLEPRTAIVYHLILAYAATSQELSQQVIDLVIERIARSLTRSTRPWAPLLAVRLASNASFDAAHRPLDRLWAQVEPTGSMIANALLPALPANAAAALHTLGRAFDGMDEGPTTFSGQFRARFERGDDLALRHRHPAHTAEAARAVTQTLRRARYPHAGRQVLQAIDEPLARLLRRSRTIGQLDAALGQFATVDRRALELALWEINDRIVDLCLHGINRSDDTTLDVLTNIERHAPGLGRLVLRAVAEDERAARALVLDGVHIQNPARQAQVLRGLLVLTDGADFDVEVDVDEIVAVWKAQASQLTSPNAIRQILLTLNLIDRSELHTFWQIARRTGLLRRAARGSVWDLPALAMLVDTLIALDLPSDARELLHAAFEDFRFVDKAPVIATSLVVHASLVLDGRKAASRFADPCGRLTQDRLALERVIDPIRCIEEIGTLAYYARFLGSAVAVDAVPPILGLPVPVATRMWGALWLEGDADTLALSQLPDEELLPASSGSQAITLMSAAQHGHLDRIAAASADWNLASAPIAVRRILELEASQMPELADLVGSMSPAGPALITEWDG